MGSKVVPRDERPCLMTRTFLIERGRNNEETKEIYLRA